MAYFPLFIDLEGKNVVVVGGGKIAARRTNVLLDFGCKILVIAPEIGAEMKELLKNSQIIWRQESYKGFEQEINPIFVLAAATEDVNLQVVNDCKALAVPVNDASKKERCDFYFPGIAKDGGLVVGVTAGGSDHKSAAALTARVRELIRND